MTLSELLIYDEIFIQIHDNPDADAIASGYGLYRFFSEHGIRTRLIYSGNYIIQKSNLVMMIKELSIPIEYVPQSAGLSFTGKAPLLITSDCQYGAGNVTHFDTPKAAIIDHHQEEISNVKLSEIRSNYGSCSTLVWKLMVDEGYSFEGKNTLGTALYYGLYSDTSQFSEIRNAVDMDMRDSLPFSPHIINALRNNNISLKELEIAGIALIRYIFNDAYKYAIIKSQPCDPNVLGLISDLVMQVDCINTCVVFHESENGIKLSVRSCTPEVKASELAEYLTKGIGSGGGHFEKAGGFIPRSLYDKKYGVLHTEAFFSDRMNKYFTGADIIYADKFEQDCRNFPKYLKRKFTIGYVDPTSIYPKGTPITIRTLEGDLELLIDDSFYVMIGVKGDVYPIKRETFDRSYTKIDEPFMLETEYIPKVRNQLTGKAEVLFPYAKTCISSGQTHIHAKELKRRVKIFTLWDDGKYMLGNPGDFMAVRCDNPKDVYIVEKDIFQSTYDRILG